MRLRDDPLLIEAAAVRASEITSRPVRHLRKDFWLTEVLRACAQKADEIGVELAFKGGTSLSKVFGLIDRFSEDVDLLVVAAGSDHAIETAMKSLVRAAEEATGLEAVLEVETAHKGDYRACYFSFPNAPDGDRGVKLELGNRGGAVPRDVRTITSPVAETAAILLGETIEEAAPFEVAVLSPARTLVEKLVILHEAHGRSGPGRDDRVRSVVRHYYDVHQLLLSEVVRAELAGIGTMVTAREVCQHTKALGMASTSYPIGGFSTSKAFNRDATLLQAGEYKVVLPQYLWPGSTLPTYLECLDVVHQYGDVL